MKYELNLFAVIVFGLIVAITLAVSFFAAKKAKSASGFFMNRVCG